MRTPAQQAAMRHAHATNTAHTARREAERLARPTSSWWIEAAKRGRFYAELHQQEPRMNAQSKHNYDRKLDAE